MARLDDIPATERKVIENLSLPTYETTPFVRGLPLAERRVALVSTAGLQRRGDRPFGVSAGDYRVIPSSVAADDLVMSHASPNFDRTGFQHDVNVVFPIDRLHELAAAGEIGSVADFHYSFMGAASSEDLAAPAEQLAELLHADDVDAVLLVPV